MPQPKVHTNLNGCTRAALGKDTRVAGAMLASPNHPLVGGGCGEMAWRRHARIVRMHGEKVRIRRSDESLTRTIVASGDRRASPPSSQLPIANPAPMRGRQSGCPNETRQVVLTRALERLRPSRWRSWRRRPHRRPGMSTSSPCWWWWSGQEKDTAHAETTPGARARGGGGRDKMRSDTARPARPTADKKPLVSPLTRLYEHH